MDKQKLTPNDVKEISSACKEYVADWPLEAFKIELESTGDSVDVEAFDIEKAKHFVSICSETTGISVSKDTLADQDLNTVLKQTLDRLEGHVQHGYVKIHDKDGYEDRRCSYKYKIKSWKYHSSEDLVTCEVSISSFDLI